MFILSNRNHASPKPDLVPGRDRHRLDTDAAFASAALGALCLSHLGRWGSTLGMEIRLSQLPKTPGKTRGKQWISVNLLIFLGLLLVSIDTVRYHSMTISMPYSTHPSAFITIYSLAFPYMHQCKCIHTYRSVVEFNKWHIYIYTHTHVRVSLKLGFQPK